MNQLTTISMTAIGLLFTTNALAVDVISLPKVGDRMYAYGRAEIPDGDETAKPTKSKRHKVSGNHDMILHAALGTGKVIAVNGDGSIVFKSDKNVSETFKGYRRYDLKPLAQCGNGKDEAMYSTLKYNDEKGELRSVGHVTLKEVFGTCEFGDALISAKDTDAPLKVAYKSLLKKVTCDFQKTKVISRAPVSTAAKAPVQGAGMAEEVYGDCKTGIVVFKADRNVGEDVIVPASSILSQQASVKTVAQRPATAASAVRR